MSKGNVKDTETRSNECIWSIPNSLPKDEFFDIGIYVDYSKDFNEKYVLELKYKNIYGTSYLQKFFITVNSGELSTTIDLCVRQEEHNNSIDELLRTYANKFNESFPVFSVQDKDETEIQNMIQYCIDNDIRYEKIDAKD